jgi:hypothetical protein
MAALACLTDKESCLADEESCLADKETCLADKELINDTDDDNDINNDGNINELNSNCSSVGGKTNSSIDSKDINLTGRNHTTVLENTGASKSNYDIENIDSSIKINSNERNSDRNNQLSIEKNNVIMSTNNGHIDASILRYDTTIDEERNQCLSQEILSESGDKNKDNIEDVQNIANNKKNMNIRISSGDNMDIDITKNDVIIPNDISLMPNNHPDPGHGYPNLGLSLGGITSNKPCSMVSADYPLHSLGVNVSTEYLARTVENVRTEINSSTRIMLKKKGRPKRKIAINDDQEKERVLESGENIGEIWG